MLQSIFNTFFVHIFVVQLGGLDFVLCKPTSSPDSCCTDLTDDGKEPIAEYGIAHGKIRTDLIKTETVTGYLFRGDISACSKTERVLFIDCIIVLKLAKQEKEILKEKKTHWIIKY